MPTEPQARQPGWSDPSLSEDEPLPPATEDEVLEETVRLAREGRRQLDADPRESRPGSA